MIWIVIFSRKDIFEYTKKAPTNKSHFSLCLKIKILQNLIPYKCGHHICYPSLITKDDFDPDKYDSDYDPDYTSETVTTASEGSVEQVIHDNQGFKESDAAERKPKEGDDDDDEDDDDGKHELDSKYLFCQGLCKL